MRFFLIGVVILVLALAGCVGTDYMDDPVVGEKIIVSPLHVALLPDQQAQVSAEYYDQYGLKQEVPFFWTSANTDVAEVSSSGLITAKASGNTQVHPSFGNFPGPVVQVTVVSDTNAVATVEVEIPANTELSIGEKVHLDAVVKNINGEELPNEVVEWFSENSNILTVTQSGEVEAVGAGIAGIHAKSNGVKSNIVDFIISGSVRTGTFSSAGGYHTSGSTKLEIVNNDLILTLSSDFDTDFALGTYIYLANSTNGPTVRSSGFQVAQIFSDGAKTFNITQLNASVELNDYKYVIALCYPASVTFGFAELK